jgi:DMSO/TMAO reductase YedYZ molybdopterin-dependent catalytic subunit
LAAKCSQPGKQNASVRVPAGQAEVKNFPHLDLGIVSDITTPSWRLRVYGLVDNALNLDCVVFQTMNQVSDTSDVHSLTRWSQLDTDWQDVRARICWH